MEIIRGMPETEYRARPELSQSDYKYFLEPTPAHAKWKREHREEKVCFSLGTAVHSAVLLGETVHAVAPKVDGRTKAGKETLAAFQAENEGKIVLSASDGEAVEGMIAGVRRNPGVVAILDSLMEREISLFHDGEKCRCDGIFPLGVLDLKTTGKLATPYLFQRAVIGFGYHIQAAFYLQMSAKAGFPAENFFVVAVESSAPHEAAIFTIGHDLVEIGRLKLVELREIYFACEKTGEYPGYSSEPVEINTPAWM